MEKFVENQTIDANAYSNFVILFLMVICFHLILLNRKYLRFSDIYDIYILIFFDRRVCYFFGGIWCDFGGFGRFVGYSFGDYCFGDKTNPTFNITDGYIITRNLLILIDINLEIILIIHIYTFFVK